MGYKFKYPSLVSIFITNRCNLRCKHCSFSSSPQVDPSQELSSPQIYKLIKEVCDLGIVCLDFSGGEPFIHPDLLSFIEFAFNHGAKSLSVATNATLINPFFAKKIAGYQRKYKFFLRVSIDGPNAKTHEYIRGKGTFKRLMNGISTLKKFGVNPREINTVIHKENYKLLNEMIKFAETLNARVLVLLPLIGLGRGKKMKDQWLTPLIWREVCIEARRLQKNTKLMIFADGPVSRTLDPDLNINKEYPCMAGHQFLGITSKGDYIACPIMDFSLGHIDKQSIAKLWQTSRILKDLRDTTLLKGACQDCKFLKVCKGGCRGLAYALKGDFKCPDPLCWIANPK